VTRGAWSDREEEDGAPSLSIAGVAAESMVATGMNSRARSKFFFLVSIVRVLKWVMMRQNYAIFPMRATNPGFFFILRKSGIKMRQKTDLTLAYSRTFVA
jgi:hypothetical protein